MQISSRFTLAVHILTCIKTFGDSNKVTSDFLASSTNVNPVIVRKILGQLKKANIVDVARGSGGAVLARPESEITFLDIYKAVDCVGNGELFHFHENPNPLCPVGRNIHTVLDSRLLKVQQAMENELSAITLKDVLNDTQKIIDTQK
ncbi:Rrf2 family transcriptional regulator [Ruminococcus sp.]|uniref:Rrf2 family transcriptional regulator n=1 Tax=Ruminococcus sp. TaxID=41978 RepID=UPI0038647B48